MRSSGRVVDSFLEILIFLPVVGAIIGYTCKWMAIKMLFHPSRWIGIGPVGWQGVVQRRSPKFAAGVADTVSQTGVSVDALLAKVPPARVVEFAAPLIAAAAPDLVRAALEEVRPGAWDTAAPPVRDGLVAQVEREAVRITGVVIGEVRPVMSEALDVRRVVLDQLSGENADRLARLFQRVGRRELQVVIYYGAVLGFLIGLLEVFGYAALERWWLLPLVGLVDGVINNWLAIQMIFRPLERKRYLGVFPFQGLFPARQVEISKEYAAMMADEVLAPKDLLAHLDPAGVARVREAALAVIDREAAPLFAMLGAMTGAPIDRARKARLLEVLTARLMAIAPAHLPAIEAALARELAIAETIDRALAVMPKAEFERVLRGVFEEDEWILVALGGVLGGAIGLLQAGIVLALQ